MKWGVNANPVSDKQKASIFTYCFDVVVLFHAIDATGSKTDKEAPQSAIFGLFWVRRAYFAAALRAAKGSEVSRLA
jgi:hypothetical protein